MAGDGQDLGRGREGGREGGGEGGRGSEDLVGLPIRGVRDHKATEGRGGEGGREGGASYRVVILMVGDASNL